MHYINFDFDFQARFPVKVKVHYQEEGNYDIEGIYIITKKIVDGLPKTFLIKLPSEIIELLGHELDMEIKFNARLRT